MSKVAIKGADTGTGVFTLESPATNTDRTLVLPDEAGTVLVNGTTSNVGINTSSPLAKLHVKGATNGNLLVRGGASSASGLTGTALSSINDAASATVSLTFEGSDFNFVENNAVVAKLDSSGNLLVGTTSLGTIGSTAGAALYADGRVLSSNVSNGSYFARMTTDGAVMYFRKNTSTVGSISVTGSATAYNTSSDYRLKEDWVAVADASARVNALKPVNFAWKADGTRVDGFLAHEVAEVVPEAVTGTKDAMRDEEYEVTPAVFDDDGNVVTPAVMGTRSLPDYQGIDQSKLVPLLTAALQEALARIETLEADVATLKGNA